MVSRPRPSRAGPAIRRKIRVQCWCCWACGFGRSQNAKQLLLCAHDAAREGWLLLAAAHNLRKLHGKTGVSGLETLATA